jgi:hypothetical protein
MIPPTPGRVVWYYPPKTETGFCAPGNGEPCAAIVAKVWGERCVNLAVFDANGVSHGRCSVPLLQDNDVAPEHGYYATWMPYQKAQHEKNAA